MAITVNDLQMAVFPCEFARVNRGAPAQAAQAYSLLDQGQIAGRALIDMGEWFPMLPYGPTVMVRNTS